MFSDGTLIKGETGPATAQIWLAEVDCLKRDQCLLNCSRSSWGKPARCTHDEDVYLRCVKAPSDEQVGCTNYSENETRDDANEGPPAGILKVHLF